MFTNKQTNKHTHTHTHIYNLNGGSYDKYEENKPSPTFRVKNKWGKKTRMAYTAKDSCPPRRFLYLTETKIWKWEGEEGGEEEKGEGKKSV